MLKTNMFETLALRLEGFGYVRNIRQKQNSFIVKIQAVNANKLYQTDECIFECRIPKKMIGLFNHLQSAIEQGRMIAISFLATYTDCYMCNCYAYNDPDRIMYFYANLDKVKCIYLDGVKHSMGKFNQIC